MFTVPVAGAALGDRYRALQRVNDVCCTDFVRCLGQPIAAIRAARRRDQPRARQQLEQFAHCRWRDTGCRGHVGSAANGGLVRCQMGEQDSPVIGKFADSEHGERVVPENKGLF